MNTHNANVLCFQSYKSSTHPHIMRDIRFSLHCSWQYKSSGILRPVYWQIFTDLSKEMGRVA